MNANIFMLFDCFLEEDQEVWGFGSSLGEGSVWGDGTGMGFGRCNGNGLAHGAGAGAGDGLKGNEGSGFGTCEEKNQTPPALCLVEIRNLSAR